MSKLTKWLEQIDEVWIASAFFVCAALNGLFGTF